MGFPEEVTVFRFAFDLIPTMGVFKWSLTGYSGVSWMLRREGADPMNSPEGQLPPCTGCLTEGTSGCRNPAFPPHPRLCLRATPAQMGYLFHFTQMYPKGGQKPSWGHQAQEGPPPSHMYVFCCRQAPR